MRIKIPWLVIYPDANPAVERQLAATLFNQAGTVEIVALTGCALAATGFVRTGDAWFLIWAAAVVAVLVGRMALARAYARDAGRRAPRAWAALFTIGALAAAVLAGLAGWHVILGADAHMRFLFVAFLVWSGTGAPARNNAAPLAAIGQACCIMGLLVVAALTRRDPSFHVFAAITLLQLVATVKVTAYLGRQTARMLVLNQKFIGASQERLGLLDEVERINRELKESNASLALLSVTDELTGLLNRRGFEARLNREWRRARRTRAPLSLLLIDIDHFKAFNDRHGHPEGDRCLVAVGAAIAGAIGRSADAVARYGGEEFAAVLPDTDLAGAAEVAEAVRQAVAGCPARGADAIGVTASIGVATLVPGPAVDRHRLVADADKALYRAKAAGRDRVRLWEPRPDEAAADVLHSAA